MKKIIIFVILLLTLSITLSNATNIYITTVPEHPTTGNFVLSINIVSNTKIKNANLILSGLVNKAIDIGDFSGNTDVQFNVNVSNPGIYTQTAILTYVEVINRTIENGSVSEIYENGYIKCRKEIVVIEKPQFKILYVKDNLYPGKSGNVTIKLINSGGTAKNVNIELKGFVVKKANRFFKSWKKGEVKTLKFKVFANNSLEVGDYSAILELSCKDKFENNYKFTLPFSISVKGKPLLVISNYSTPKLYPDMSFTMKISVENTGKDKAKDVKLKLTLPKGFIGENLALLGDICRNEMKTATFYLKTSKNVSGNVKLPVIISCLSGSWKDNLTLYVFPLKLPHIDISGVYTIPERPTTGKLTLNLAVENSGKGNAKGVEVKLILPKELIGRNTYFIGSLTSGDSATSTFELSAKKAGEYNITAEITYLDSAMQKHTVYQSFTIYVFSSMNYIPMLVILILIAVALLVVKKWRF